MRFFSLLLSRSPLVLFLAAVLLCSRGVLADPINVTASQVTQFTLAPSADSLAFDMTTTMFDPNSGASFLFQTGTFWIGNSGSLIQDVPFSFQEQITIGDVTNLVTISGDDNITTDWDTLQINGTGPIAFGAYTLTVQPFTISDDMVGDADPVTLDATVTPEPGALLLVGTGLAGWGVTVARKARSRAISRSTQESA